MLNQDFREFIQSLNANSVRYLVVGGYAVALHGHPRFTKHIDIWIDATGANAARLVKALKKGARYYLGGTRMAERNGRDWCSVTEADCLRDQEPYPFYDPFARDDVYMLDELVLEVRQTSRGELLLHHLWLSSDRGFALIGGQSELYRRVNEAE